jgi:hypothetical protein
VDWNSLLTSTRDAAWLALAENEIPANYDPSTGTPFEGHAGLSQREARDLVDAPWMEAHGWLPTGSAQRASFLGLFVDAEMVLIRTDNHSHPMPTWQANALRALLKQAVDLASAPGNVPQQILTFASTSAAIQQIGERISGLDELASEFNVAETLGHFARYLARSNEEVVSAPVGFVFDYSPVLGNAMGAGLGDVLAGSMLSRFNRLRLRRRQL